MPAARRRVSSPASSPHRRLRSARLYLVCDEPAPALLAAALRGGVDIVQLRMKQASDPQILRAAAQARKLCRAHGALLILNDRPDLAVEAEADGVHIGQDDVPIGQARQLLGPERLVGLSTHTPGQVDAAEGADYIGVGPVYPTPTKPGRPPVGLELVRYASAHANRPVFAIGGISVDNVAVVAAAGASRIAVVRALTQATDPEATARRLRGPLTAGKEALVGSA